LISHTNSNFWKLYKKLPLNIRETAKKQYRLFASDPYHASLHFKCVHSARPINYRAVGVLEENIIVWFWIGLHDDYDRLLR